MCDVRWSEDGLAEGSRGQRRRRRSDACGVRAGLAREKAELEQRVAALSRNQLGGLEDQMTEVERLEGTARLLGSIAGQIGTATERGCIAAELSEPV
eukprot:3536689-Rhodomonas_salina.1